MIEILIADDHALLVDMLEAHLRKLDGCRVVKAYDFDQAIAAADMPEPPALALLDLVMPGMNGVEGVRRFRQLCPRVPVAVISGDTAPATAASALQAGACGFLPKTMGRRAMLHAVKQMLEGNTYVPPRCEKASPATALQLSPRECDVFSLLARGKSNKDIARELDLQVVTVTLHLGNIYRKLGVTGRTAAVRVALEAGLA